MFTWVLSAAIAVSLTTTTPGVAEAHERAWEQQVEGERVLAHVVADSVLLGARQQLRDLGLRVDAVEGRQPARLIGAVKRLPDDGLPVVVHLGTNGRFASDVCEDLRRLIEGERDVVFVTVRAPRSWIRPSNSTIRACASNIDGSAAALVSWHRLATTDSRLLYSDGIHLTPRGATFLVERIRLSLGLCDEEAGVLRGQQIARVGRICETSDAHEVSAAHAQPTVDERSAPVS